jgi:hypothetical protein
VLQGDVDRGELEVPPDHRQGGVPEQALEGEHVAAGKDEALGAGMAHSVSGAAHAGDPRLGPIAGDDRPQILAVQGLPATGDKERIVRTQILDGGAVAMQRPGRDRTEGELSLPAP